MPFRGLPKWNPFRRQQNPNKERERASTPEQPLLEFFNSYAKPSKALTPVSKRYYRSEAAERRLCGYATTPPSQEITLAERSSSPPLDSELSTTVFEMNSLPADEPSTMITIPSSPPVVITSISAYVCNSTRRPETLTPDRGTMLDWDSISSPSELPRNMIQQRDLSTTPDPVRAVRSSTSQFLRVTEQIVDSVDDSPVLEWAFETPVLVPADVVPHDLPVNNDDGVSEDIDDSISEDNDEGSSIDALNLPIIMPGEADDDKPSMACEDTNVANDEHRFIRDLVRDGDTWILATPQFVRPLPTPPRPFVEHPDRIPQIDWLNHPLHGFKQLSEDYITGEDMLTFLNDMKWCLQLDESTHEGDVCDIKAWNPEDEHRELQNITVTWRSGLNIEILERLIAYCNGNNTGTRDCADELYAENALLKRRVVELEKTVERTPSYVDALTAKIALLEAKLDTVLNNGMHTVASTRMAEKSIDRISTAMKPTISSLARAKPKPSKLPQVAAPKALHVQKTRASRRPLEIIEQNDPLRKRIVSNKAPKMLSEAISFEAPAPMPGRDEETEDDLTAFNQYRNIMRLGRPSSDANLFHVDNPEQAHTTEDVPKEDMEGEQDQSELVRVISGYFGTPGRVMMEKVVDENALDGSVLLRDLG